jgi:peptide methionine sulfoxide reductase MsrA
MGDNAGTAVLAGGCFWGVQELMRQQPGVIATRGGWTGGDTIADVDASVLWPGKVVTEIKPAGEFWGQRNGAKSAQQEALILPDPERG